MFKKAVVLSASLFLAACSAPKYTVNPIQENEQRKEITIVKDDATRAIFLDTMQEWCLDNAKRCTLVPDGSHPNPSELTLIYVSRWSWDLSTYISDSRINAYKDERKVGEVEFKAPDTINTDKWGDDRKRILMMLDLLFGKQTATEAHSKIESGEI
ncbi:Sbal_3080 family lipoprotein [Vibrio rumoiensis]|uniref:Sbal_3080 family lipoprotein n=1 Tax=Vibrio rumoiensis TaxID=76258 RepID=UPI000B5C672C|nr:Sbal_3080 family lipoprotein [Vibrio rumoiensis]